MNELANATVIYLWTQFWQIGVVGLIVFPVVLVAARTKPHVALVLAYLIIAKACLPPVWGHSKSFFHWLDQDGGKHQAAAELDPAMLTQEATPLTSTRPTLGSPPISTPKSMSIAKRYRLSPPLPR